RRAVIGEAARARCGRRDGVRLHLQPQSPQELQREGRELILSGDLTGTCILECSIDLLHWNAIQSSTMPNEGMASSICGPGKLPCAFIACVWRPSSEDLPVAIWAR